MLPSENRKKQNSQVGLDKKWVLPPKMTGSGLAFPVFVWVNFNTKLVPAEVSAWLDKQVRYEQVSAGLVRQV